MIIDVQPTKLKPVRTVAPAEMPISLAEVKSYLGITGTADDALLNGLIAAATDWLDGFAGILGRCLVTQTWVQNLAAFPPARTLRLPLMPTSAIVSLTYYDIGNTLQTLAAADYAGPFAGVETDYIEAVATSWPATYERSNAVAVTFTAGYGDAAAVPGAIKSAMLLLIQSWYEDHARGTSLESESVPGVLTQAFRNPQAMPRPAAVDYLLDNYRRLTFF